MGGPTTCRPVLGFAPLQSWLRNCPHARDDIQCGVRSIIEVFVVFTVRPLRSTAHATWNARQWRRECSSPAPVCSQAASEVCPLAGPRPHAPLPTSAVFREADQARGNGVSATDCGGGEGAGAVEPPHRCETRCTSGARNSCCPCELARDADSAGSPGCSGCSASAAGSTFGAQGCHHGEFYSSCVRP